MCTSIIRHDRFIGLWTYRPYGGTRRFCASVIVDGEVQETEMYNDWEDALRQAAGILESTNETTTIERAAFARR